MKKLLILIVLLLIPSAASALGKDWQSVEGPTRWERAWIDQAMTCKAYEKYKDPFLLLRILRMENHPDIRVPDEWRGMVLAASCNESRYNPAARGDLGQSVGFTQIRLSRIKGYIGNWGKCNYFNRKDPIGNVKCWLMRIRDTYDGKKRPGVPLAKQRCGKKNGWPSAWVWIAVSPSPKGKMWQCWNRGPRGHMKRFRKWKRRADKALARSGYYTCTEDRCLVE